MNNQYSADDLISRGYTKVGSKIYCSYWKKGDHTVIVYDETTNVEPVAVDEIQQLRNKLEEVLDKLDNLQEQHCKDWKEKADMIDQGASTAYEHSYWLLKKVLDE